MQIKQNILSYDAMATKYMTHQPNATEVIRQTLYDKQEYAAAGQSQLQFFQTPKGQLGKTSSDTNMTNAGMLPAGQSFLIEAVSLFYFPGLTGVTYDQLPSLIETAEPTPTLNPFINDVYTFGSNGNLDLKISSKSYLEESPLAKFPAPNGLSMNSSVASSAIDSTLQNDYACNSGPIYKLTPSPLMLIPTTNFNLSLNWPTVLPMPSGQAGTVICTFHGVMYRFVQ